jgi:molybdopterin adenylyltransferase
METTDPTAKRSDAKPIRAAILTVSDKGSEGKRVDESGPALARWLAVRAVQIAFTAIVADEQAEIVAKLREWADFNTADLILTTGGTGVAPRDVTPEATMQVVDRVIPGFGEAMRAASAAKIATAILSRAVCGSRNQTLILNLPGSPTAAIENLEAVWAAVPHAVRKLQGDATDCAPRR